jgi:hypothetical protein
MFGFRPDQIGCVWGVLISHIFACRNSLISLFPKGGHMKLGLVATTIVAALTWTSAWASPVTLNISWVPADTPANATITLGANINDWKPDHPNARFAKTDKGFYTLTLEVPDGTTFEYKVTLGSWASVELAPDGKELPNRVLRVVGPITVDFKVGRWASVSTTVAVPVKQSTMRGRIESASRVS